MNARSARIQAISVSYTHLGGAVAGVRVEMGSPEFCPEKIPVRGAAWGEELALSGKRLRFYAVRMGVPHAVLLVEDAADPEWMCLGAQIEANTALFPERINVNFVQVISKSQAAIRTYERGAGPTLACGTGSCAAAVVLHKLGLCRAQVEMLHAPGTLLIELQGEKVFMPVSYTHLDVYKRQYSGCGENCKIAAGLANCRKGKAQSEELCALFLGLMFHMKHFRPRFRLFHVKHRLCADPKPCSAKEKRKVIEKRGGCWYHNAIGGERVGEKDCQSKSEGRRRQNDDGRQF